MQQARATSANAPKRAFEPLASTECKGQSIVVETHESLLREIFMLPQPGDDRADKLSIDETLGKPPGWVHATKGARAVWYATASRNIDKLTPSMRTHVEVVTRSTLRINEIEKLLATLPACERYGDGTRNERAWIAAEQNRRHRSLAVLRDRSAGRPVQRN